MSVLHSTKALVRDANCREIQGAATLQSYDAADTPLYSPSAITATATGFKVPTGAVAFVFRGDVALRYGIQSTLTGAAAASAYDIVDSGATGVVQCAGLAGSQIYVRTESGSGNLYWHFDMLS